MNPILWSIEAKILTGVLVIGAFVIVVPTIKGNSPPPDGETTFNSSSSAQHVLGTNDSTSALSQPQQSLSQLNTPPIKPNLSNNITVTPAPQLSGIKAQPTSVCNDGTYSYSVNHQGTCSHHGGVSEWLDGSSSVTPIQPSTPTYTPPAINNSIPDFTLSSNASGFDLSQQVNVYATGTWTITSCSGSGYNESIGQFTLTFYKTTTMSCEADFTPSWPGSYNFQITATDITGRTSSTSTSATVSAPLFKPTVNVEEYARVGDTITVQVIANIPLKSCGGAADVSLSNGPYQIPITFSSLTASSGCIGSFTATQAGTYEIATSETSVYGQSGSAHGVVGVN